MRTRPVIDAEDIETVVEMGREFFDATCYGEVARFDEEAIRGRVRKLASGEGIALLAEDESGAVGMCGAGFTVPWIDPSLRLAYEVFWWVRPVKRGGRAAVMLYDALEDWARPRAKGLMMLSTPNLRPESVAKFYARRGFRRWDTQHLKMF